MMISFQERVRGVVFGTAYGDALGATVEKLSYQEKKKRYSRVESINTEWYKATWPAEKRLHRMRGYGIITDDTLMTLALMKVYCSQQRHLDAYDLADEFVKEIAFRNRYIPELGKEALILDRLFYPEKYIFIRHVLANCDPREGGIGNMVNCGAAMYIAPVGVVNATNPKAAYDEAIAFAMGHQLSYGLEAAGVLAACVAKAFEPEVSVEDIIKTALMYAKDGTKKAIEAIGNVAIELKSERDNKDLIVEKFHQTILEFSPMGDDIERKIEKTGKPSNHYTPSRLFSIEELPIALGYIVLYDGDFAQAIIDGINSGRDTDSIGVMIGVILGAMYGYQVFDRADIEILERVNQQNFLKNADQFAKTAKIIIEKDLVQLEKRKKLLKQIAL
ncbi:MAG: ADP-ribosylglycohydrolase family protein [Halanaerobiales bacterium]|nr:ADP-ribosylglycohydrolase family protein [Halanaerobiales bacterium]